MATQTAQQRIDGAGEWMRQNRDPCGVTKSDLRAAYNAIDQYFSDNAAAMNSTLPQPARGTLTTTQKAQLTIRVITDRYLNGV